MRFLTILYGWDSFQSEIAIWVGKKTARGEYPFFTISPNFTTYPLQSPTKHGGNMYYENETN